MSAKEGLVLLVWPKPGAQAGTEGSLESVDCGFGEGSAAVMVGAFPVRLAHETDFSDRTVSFN